jgi:hypothetical protein
MEEIYISGLELQIWSHAFINFSSKISTWDFGGLANSFYLIQILFRVVNVQHILYIPNL